MQALQRRVFSGQEDPRGAQGMLSRGANVYRGGLPQAQGAPGGQSAGNPAMGRPSTSGLGGGAPVNLSLSGLVGSLPPGQGSPDLTMNNAVMDLIRQKQQRSLGV